MLLMLNVVVVGGFGAVTGVPRGVARVQVLQREK